MHSLRAIQRLFWAHKVERWARWLDGLFANHNTGSFNGRTVDFESTNHGSNPCVGTNQQTPR